MKRTIFVLAMFPRTRQLASGSWNRKAGRCLRLCSIGFRPRIVSQHLPGHGLGPIGFPKIPILLRVLQPKNVPCLEVYNIHSQRATARESVMHGAGEHGRIEQPHKRRKV